MFLIVLNNEVKKILATKEVIEYRNVELIIPDVINAFVFFIDTTKIFVKIINSVISVNIKDVICISFFGVSFIPKNIKKLNAITTIKQIIDINFLLLFIISSYNLSPHSGQNFDFSDISLLHFGHKLI